MLKLIDQSIGGYERVVRATDETTGLDACIAIHNIQLGPAIGGCRYMEYKDFDEQRSDALRLSKGMTYKNALAGLHNGGGKTTINANAGKKTPDLWKSFAEALDRLGGTYYTAGDIGTTQEDLTELHKYTQYVLGYLGSDSSWATAYGLFNSMIGAWFCYQDEEHPLHDADFRNKFIEDFSKTKQSLKIDNEIFTNRSIGVIGLGKVGTRLIHFLNTYSVKLTIYCTDIDKQNYHNAREFAFEHTPNHRAVQEMDLPRIQWCENLDELLTLPLDIISPCAVGGIIDSNFVEKCRAKVICGGANNQLTNDEVAQKLLDRGILYVPDYLANSGGVIHVSSSYDISHDITVGQELNWNHSSIIDKLNFIRIKTFDILKQSQEQNKPTNIVAKEIVEEKLKNL